MKSFFVNGSTISDGFIDEYGDLYLFSVDTACFKALKFVGDLGVNACFFWKRILAPKDDEFY